MHQRGRQAITAAEAIAFLVATTATTTSIISSNISGGGGNFCLLAVIEEHAGKKKKRRRRRSEVDDGDDDAPFPYVEVLPLLQKKMRTQFFLSPVIKNSSRRIWQYSNCSDSEAASRAQHSTRTGQPVLPPLFDYIQ